MYYEKRFNFVINNMWYLSIFKTQYAGGGKLLRMQYVKR